MDDEEDRKPLECCGGQYLPGEQACSRTAREMVLAMPSPQMVAAHNVPWQVYPVCAVYHRGAALAQMIRQADPQATVLVFASGSELKVGQYEAARLMDVMQPWT